MGFAGLVFFECQNVGFTCVFHMSRLVFAVANYFWLFDFHAGRIICGGAKELYIVFRSS